MSITKGEKAEELVIGAFLTISVRQVGVPAQRTMTLEDDRPLDRHATGNRNVMIQSVPHCLC